MDPTLLRTSFQTATALPPALTAILACVATSVPVPVTSRLLSLTGVLQVPAAAAYRANQMFGSIGPPLGRPPLKRFVCCCQRTRTLPLPSCATTGSATPRVPSLSAAGADHEVPSKRLHTTVGNVVVGLCSQTTVARPTESITAEGEPTNTLDPGGGTMLMRTGAVQAFDVAL